MFYILTNFDLKNRYRALKIQKNKEINRNKAMDYICKILNRIIVLQKFLKEF